MNTFFSKYFQGYLRGSAKCINTQYTNWGCKYVYKLVPINTQFYIKVQVRQFDKNVVIGTA